MQYILQYAYTQIGNMLVDVLMSTKLVKSNIVLALPSNSMWFLTCCQREARRRRRGKWPEKIDGYRRRKHMTSVSSVWCCIVCCYEKLNRPASRLCTYILKCMSEEKKNTLGSSDGSSPIVLSAILFQRSFAK